MCLIPTQVIREIGLSLPMFIKWDDAEFGLRAGEAGYPTVTLPGCRGLARAVDREGRHARLAGLLPRAQPARRRACCTRRTRAAAGWSCESLENHVKRLMSMQYGTGETILLALQDVLDGPERMHRDMPAPARARSARCATQYDDGQSEADPRRVPAAAAQEAAAKRGKGIPVADDARSGKVKMAAIGPGAPGAPDRASSRRSTPRASSRTSTSGGTGWRTSTRRSSRRPTASRRRGTAGTPPQFRDQMARSIAMHARLYQEWPTSSPRGTARRCPS